MTLTNQALEVIEELNSVEARDRLELLIDYSNELPPLPERYSDHPDLLERVEECQSPVYLFVEVNQSIVSIFLTAPKEAPTTRAFASILHKALDGQTASDVLNFDDDFPNHLGITQLVSPLRMRGIRGMLSRIKRQVAEKNA